MMSLRERLAMAYLRGFREAVTSRAGSTPAAFAEQPSTRSLYMDGWHAGIETRDRAIAEGESRADQVLELRPVRGRAS